ncbi:MAG TPA: hypothetical protein VFZ31_06580, partial [Vicinamibacterales bacterium]
VRVGANAPDIAQTEPFVRQSLALGLHVSVNLMKSYAVPPARLVELSRMAEGYGAQVVSLVDSAGTMLPDDVRTYVSAMKDALSVEIGFHGHDNLALGMANVLAAIEAGAAVVDTTLQGIGRGGGNAVTEILVAILHKQGVSTGIDLNRLMDLSERVVRPLLKGKGHDPLNITSGFAGFHSSALEMILRHADRHHVDPRDLIVEVSGVDRVDVTSALVESVAAELSRRQQGRSGVHVVDRPASFADPSGAGRSFAELASDAARKARTVAIKSGRRSVFNVVAAPQRRERSSVSAFVQEEFESVIASAEVHDSASVRELAAAIGADIDVWLADADVQPGGWSPAAVLAEVIEPARLLAYRDSDTWIRAVDLQIASLSPDTSVPALIVGSDAMAMRAALALADRGRRVTVAAAHTAAVESAIGALARPASEIVFAADAVTAARDAAVLVAFARGAIGADVVDQLPDAATIFDAGIGALQPGAVERASGRGIRVVRPDMRAALAAELAAAAGTRRVATELMGRGDLDGVAVVGGGLVGRAGDVVVDSMTNPTRVLGVATGDGGVNYAPGPELAERVTRVQRAIWRRKLGAEVS